MWFCLYGPWLLKNNIVSLTWIKGVVIILIFTNCWFMVQSNLPKRPPAINDHFYSPRRFILYILTGFNDHLHNATNDRQNTFPNNHFNFFQRPLTLLHDELTTKMGKLTGVRDVPQRSNSFSVYANRKWFFLYPK